MSQQLGLTFRPGPTSLQLGKSYRVVVATALERQLHRQELTRCAASRGRPLSTSVPARYYVLSHILAGCKRHTTVLDKPDTFTKRNGYVTPTSQAGCQVPERWDV